MSRDDVLKYSGNGIPPFCKMTIKSNSDEGTPQDLQVHISFRGICLPNDRMKLSIPADPVPQGKVYNVFCHKKKLKTHFITI